MNVPLLFVWLIGKKLSDGEALSEKDKLKLAWIDTFQSFYGLAQGENKGDCKKMSRATHATWTISWKMLSMKNVYKGQSSWCSFNWNKATGKSSHLFIKNPVLKPVFDKLGSKIF